MNDIIFFTSYCDTIEKSNILLENIEFLKKNYSDKKIGVHANFPLSENIQKNVDHYIFEDLNFNYKKNDINFYFWEHPSFDKKLISYISNLDYGLSSLNQIKNISYYFKNYDRIIICNYDIDFNSIDFNLMDSDLNLYEFDKNGNSYSLVLFSFNPKIFYDKISKHFTKEDYFNFENGPEQFFYKIVNESDINKKYIEQKPKDKIGGFQDVFYCKENNYFKYKFLSFDDNPNLYLWGNETTIKSIEIEISDNKRTILYNKIKNQFHSEIDFYSNEFKYLKIIKINENNVDIMLYNNIDENFIKNNKSINK